MYYFCEMKNMYISLTLEKILLLFGAACIWKIQKTAF